MIPSETRSRQPGAEAIRHDEDPSDGGGFGDTTVPHGRGEARLKAGSHMVLAGVFCVLAASIVYPFAGKGWLLLLDWVTGPRVSLARSFWGLDGSVTASIPFHLLDLGLSRLAGPAATSWLLIALVFPVAGLGAGRLAGRSIGCRLVAGFVYALSPIVYERLWAGQIGFLLGYAALPWAIASMMAARRRPFPLNLTPALWMALLVALSPHFAFIAGLVLLGIVVAEPRRRVLGWLAIIGVATVLMSAYLVAGSSNRSTGITVGTGDVAAFRTRGDPSFGVYVNVAGMYGFWRQEPPLPKDDSPAWPFLLGVLVTGSAVGFRAGWRDRERRVATMALLFAAISGYFLALGDQGPTASIYRALFRVVPGFDVMREPQKFVALVAVAYAVFFAWGVAAVAERATRVPVRVPIFAFAVIVPLVYNPSLFGGMRGRVRTSHFPASWAAADRLMGTGPGRVLALPWHQYLGYEFTNGRIIMNPTAGALRRDVISGDNVELPNVDTASTLARSRFLSFLFSVGSSTHSAGHLLAPLGVEYVVLEKTADWASYGWLQQQQDLERVLETDELVVYRNRAGGSTGFRAAQPRLVADWGELVALADVADVSHTAINAVSPRPGAVRLPADAGGPESSAAFADAHRLSPIKYRVDGGAGTVAVIPEPFDASWSVNGRSSGEEARGVTVVQVGAAKATVEFRLWHRLRASYLLSVAVAVLIGASYILFVRRRSLRRFLTSGDQTGKAAAHLKADESGSSV